MSFRVNATLSTVKVDKKNAPPPDSNDVLSILVCS